MTVRERLNAVLTGAVGYEAGLDALTVAPAAEVDAVLLAALGDACGLLWRRGWQPVELRRVIARQGSTAATHLVTDAVAEHLRPYPRKAVDERWLAQAEELGAQAWWTEPASYLTEFAGRWRLDRVAVLDAVLTLLRALADLPAIEVLIPPPGAAVQHGRSVGRHGIDARMLNRVRALLAKAESTTYPAEAQAYTAKAQELVARHSIDEALLVARTHAVVVPFARRIGVDHPYESEKAALLDAVARANRCHVVWSPELAFATVFGFDADIDAVDLLHTSLLVQAHHGMAQTEPPGGKAGRARLKAFRQSFLVAFAVRIGERLEQAAQSAYAEAAAQDTGDIGGLLPVLASRDEQVRQAMQTAFPRTTRTRGSRVDSHEGWTSGRAAAERAHLHTPTPAADKARRR